MQATVKYEKNLPNKVSLQTSKQAFQAPLYLITLLRFLKDILLVAAGICFVKC